MAGTGLPTKYKPEYCELLKEHMSQGYSYESFAARVKVHKDTLYNWEKLFPDYSDAKKEAVDLCRFFWEKQGIDGVWEETLYDDKGRPTKSRKLNSAVWIFNMKNRFQWTDRVEHSGKENKPILLQYTKEDAEKKDGTKEEN